MSDSSRGADMRTPMPRRPDTHYFHEHHDEDSYYGVTSSDMRDVEASMSLRATELAVDPSLLAQQELVARALSPEAAPAVCHSPGGDQVCRTGSDRAPSRIGRTEYPTMLSESVLSSRPGTPLSAPSNLPVPSNPSSFPEDQQNGFAGPTLVMPSVEISQRKPFTPQGRTIGKLRVMFCGDSSSGKTTLLRTMAERSPDIVHVENTTGSEPGRATTEINEVRASSQPCPSWRRRVDTGLEGSDTAMERNLCLIDTPGYGLSAETDDAIAPILRYLEAQFCKTNEVLRDNNHLADEDFLNLIASPQGGFTHVDAIIYCAIKSLTETDITFIQKLSAYAMVILVIAKADLLEQQVREEICQAVKEHHDSLGVQLFADSTTSESPRPYFVSCLDPEIEASIMMDNLYVPELLPSDLDALFDDICHAEHPARLRHLAAKKFFDWKLRLQREQSLIHLPESEMTLRPSADFTISRIAEHTKQEDREARLRIAAWASEMRNSFALSNRSIGDGTGYTSNEKSAEWLITRMNDYVEAEKHNVVARRIQDRRHLRDERDPLGLIRLRERWSKRLRRACRWCLDLGFAVTGVYLCYNLWRRMLSVDVC